MAIEITRTAWVDDDGTGMTGTVLNNAMKIGLYDQIDAVLNAPRAAHLLFTDGVYDIGASGASRPRDLFLSRHAVIGGVLTVNGYGSHVISASGAVQALTLRNTNPADTSPEATIFVDADSTHGVSVLATIAGGVAATLRTYGEGNHFYPGLSELFASGAGGLNLKAIDAAGAIRFYSGGATERGRWTVDGGFGLADGITAPATEAGFAVLYVDVADGDLKVKFGDGTVKTLSTDT